jgi:hypothetical protein
VRVLYPEPRDASDTPAARRRRRRPWPRP